MRHRDDEYCRRILTLVLVGLSIGLGNFAASIAIGVSGVDRRLRLRIAIVFGTFEGGMPVVGLLIGHRVAGSLGGHATEIGGVLLGLTGLYSLTEAIIRRRHSAGERRPADNGWGRLTIAGAALSVDNLVVGFALGTTVNLVLAAIVIGSVCVAMSLAGLELGGHIGGWLGPSAELLGGVVLIAVGVAVGTGVL